MDPLNGVVIRAIDPGVKGDGRFPLPTCRKRCSGIGLVLKPWGKRLVFLGKLSKAVGKAHCSALLIA
jgi:hypothetical protein